MRPSARHPYKRSFRIDHKITEANTIFGRLNLENNHGGLKARLVKEGALHRFVNVYVNDEDVRFAGGLEAAVKDGDNVTILPAVAGG